MVSFVVIVPTILGQQARQRILPEQNYFRQALLFYGANPRFRERSQILAFGGQLNRLHATACERVTDQSQDAW